MVYINTKSNHPPNIINGLTESISNRISSISSNETLFSNAAPQYNDALKKSGYLGNITFKSTTQPSNHETRKRRYYILWYNPPFSLNVKTDIGKKFLYLILKHIPPNNKFHNLFNKNNVKISYSCLPNIGSIINSHNKRILTTNDSNDTSNCNCRQKNTCPLNGNCIVKF